MASCEIRGAFKPGFDDVLTPHALEFVARLTERFGARVDELLATRDQRQADIDEGLLPSFADRTRQIRDLDWIIADIPEDLLDRRVELLTPARKEAVRAALRSEVSVCIADLEDTLSPTWDNIIQGHRCLQSAATGTLLAGEGAPPEHPVTLGMRPRGWHMEEKHLYVDGRPVPAALADFGLYLFHCAQALTARGSGPYLSLPKLEGHQEARLWASVFEFAENDLGLRQYGIRATAFIETVPAIFEIDEILYVLKGYLVGLECGPADYVFSFIKTLHAHADFVLPDQLNFDRSAGFLESYSKLAVRTAHQRSILAIGGTAASLAASTEQTDKVAFADAVRAQKQREFEMGFDGTWVGEPGMVPVISEILAELMPGPNQLSVLGGGEEITAEALLSPPKGPVTEPGVRRNIRFALRYLSAWLAGEGCIFFNNRREDMATAESARAQLWQWVHHDVTLETGELMDEHCFRRLLAEELPAAASDLTDLGVAGDRLTLAAELISDLVLRKDFVPFLSTHAYAHLP
ncbi:MAG: malate synthase A [Pseudomonadota bacterium]